MKKFLLYILSIFTIITVGLFVLDIIYTWGYGIGTPRNKVSYIMQRENDTIDFIFIGSSRVDNTINADIITLITGKSAINLGIQAAKTDDYLILLKLLKERNIRAEHIFIQIDYVFNITGNSEILMSQLMPYINNKVINEAIKERDPEYYQLKFIPFYRYLKYDYKIGFREFFNSTLGNKNKIDFENGFDPKFGSSGQNLESSLPANIINENTSINRINDFAELNNLSIIYFMAPFCKNTTNSSFSSKLNAKLPVFLDYSKIFNKQNDNFYNCDHLNNKGASEFSRIIATDIKGFIKK